MTTGLPNCAIIQYWHYRHFSVVAVAMLRQCLFFPYISPRKWIGSMAAYWWGPIHSVRLLHILRHDCATLLLLPLTHKKFSSCQREIEGGGVIRANGEMRKCSHSIRAEGARLRFHRLKMNFEVKTSTKKKKKKTVLLLDVFDVKVIRVGPAST